MQTQKLRSITEGAVMVAMAQILGYLKLYEFPFGGSITLAMIPIFFYCIRWGLGSGLLMSFVFSVLQLMFDGAYAYTWQAMILDYLLAFTLLGVSGVFKGKKYGLFFGTVLGSALRFVSHLFSGVYVWAEYMPEEFLGMKMTSPWLYSAIYNGIYTGANMVIAILVFALLLKPLEKYIEGRDIR
jgi:Predicted membrane protein